MCRGQGCLRGRHAVAAQWTSEGVAFRCLHRGPERPHAGMRNGLAHVPAGTFRPSREDGPELKKGAFSAHDRSLD